MSNQILQRFKEYISGARFNAVKIGLASPQKIRSLSYGEIKKIETINYRTLKPERDGLFCARIFGPVKDWECNCGKYKRMKHRGVTCEKCGVEVIQSRVRRERMGHINLVAPVCHIWYLKGIPSYLGLIMDMSIKDLERVIYFDVYMVVKQGKSPYPRKSLLTNTEYEDYLDANPQDTEFFAEMGAEAVRQVLANENLDNELQYLLQDYEKTSSLAVRLKLMRRMRILKNLIQAKLRPEWMIFDVLPVLPPDLRPLVPLEGGRFASSDLNELYRRVLNRNIRLQRLIEIQAPAIIIKNEKRMLQESVDALIDNGRRGQPVRGTNRRPLKSLSELLRGKQGRFRQNLLGRRVDYSGRSVIVVDPELRLDQCGIPKLMALELFKPYVYAGLLESEIAANMRVARTMVADLAPEIWDVLENAVRNRPVLLNRAPTLHRLGIQAFFPILVDGKAIRIHPLVCHSFNADFDGDQMAVHLPLSIRAQQECRSLILSSKNILSPSNGRPLTIPTLELVLGLYFLTKARCGLRGEGIVFASVSEVVMAYQCHKVDLHARIKVRLADGKIVNTTVGRVLLFNALPEGSDFAWINKILKKNDLARLVETIYYQFGEEKTVLCLDQIKKLGYHHATFGGISLSLVDLRVPKVRDQVIHNAEQEVAKANDLYMNGIITNGERYNKVISIWGNATTEVADAMYVEFEQEDVVAFENKNNQKQPFNFLFMMLESGARGSKDQIKQLVGMRGVMSKPNGEIMETPVKTNFKEGLRVYEYFISTHGARKGQADTALKTANSGYLTRRLADIAHDVVITIDDCKTLGYIELESLKESGEIIYPVAQRAYGRVAAADIKDAVTGKVIIKQGNVITRDDVQILGDAVITKILVRSVLTCQATRGVCAHCYGYDLSKGTFVDVGTTVGVIAAQSIGEPGTQLTMRTFHIGGTAGGFAEQSFVKARHNGFIEWRGMRTIVNSDDQQVVMSRKAQIVIIAQDGRELENYDIPYGSVILVQHGQEVTAGTKLAEWDPTGTVLLTEKAGYIRFVDLIDNVTIQERFDKATNRSNRVVLETRSEKYQPALAIVDEHGEEIAHYLITSGAYLNVTDGQYVNIGDILVKTPREALKTKDIATGLPRIAELFEARTPKDVAILSDIDGEVVIGGLHRGLRKVSVVSGSENYDYYVPRGKQLTVVHGEMVSAGDQLTSGSPVLHDILRILGTDTVLKYLVGKIQEIYRLQGVDINDRHIEVIVRQMIRKVRITDPGDSDFLIGDRIDRLHFKAVNDTLRAQNKKTAKAKPVLMGLTQGSLGTESFISAASFQETTRILAEAAVSGQIDHLYGLKENVIVGKLIPAGTGIKSFREKYLGDDSSDFERKARQEEAIGQ
ncbi:MAG TPA: DNA-directed RNA polymerase subunit beta' [Candidatus Babeliales bacterium]|nr:DNA-directed RNA polymerase subunit beta' [Candidatus Babeliales bacterium]